MSAREGRSRQPEGEVQQAARDQFSKNGGEILDRENQIKGCTQQSTMLIAGLAHI